MSSFLNSDNYHYRTRKHVMILTQYGDSQNYEWYTVRYDSRTRTATRDRLFHVDLMKIH